MVLRRTMDQQSRKSGKTGKKLAIKINSNLSLIRSSLNQLTAFQQVRTPSHYLQSTTLTTTSGLGSNYTSYTTDPSLSSLENRKAKFNPAAPGTSSSFLESDLPNTDEYLYVPDEENPRFMSPHMMNQTSYGGKTINCKVMNEVFDKVLISQLDFYIPAHHSIVNPFHQAPIFVNSGPQSFIDFNQYESEYYAQYLDQPPPPPPKTPIRTPVMGTRLHRRTLSNTSSQYSSNRGGGSQADYGEVINPQDLDYRFNNFNISGAIEREPLQFHSVPYNCNQPESDTTNSHPIPNRMRLYENVSHFQHLRDSSTSSSQIQTPIKTSYIDTTNHQPELIKTTSSITNSMRREMFFNPEPQQKINGGENHQSEMNPVKLSGNTGCTPTHSTPQDSFSDDSSYLSALSSQNRVRFGSPDNFLSDNAAFSPTSRAAVVNLQRAMAKRTMELEEGEKS